MSTSPMPNDLLHALLASELDDESRSIALELAADPNVLESSLIDACHQAGFTKEEIIAFLQLLQAPGHGIFMSREQPAWQVTDGVVWQSLNEWATAYRAKLEAVS